jgi:hypothetical protein
LRTAWWNAASVHLSPIVGASAGTWPDISKNLLLSVHAKSIIFPVASVHKAINTCANANADNAITDSTQHSLLKKSVRRCLFSRGTGNGKGKNKGKKENEKENFVAANKGKGNNNHTSALLSTVSATNTTTVTTTAPTSVSVSVSESVSSDANFTSAEQNGSSNSNGEIDSQQDPSERSQAQSLSHIKQPSQKQTQAVINLKVDSPGACIGWLYKLPKVLLREVVNIIKVIKLKKGQTLYKAGDKADNLFMLHRGLLRRSINVPSSGSASKNNTSNDNSGNGGGDEGGSTSTSKGDLDCDLNRSNSVNLSNQGNSYRFPEWILEAVIRKSSASGPSNNIFTGFNDDHVRHKRYDQLCCSKTRNQYIRSVNNGVHGVNWDDTSYSPTDDVEDEEQIIGKHPQPSFAS